MKSLHQKKIHKSCLTNTRGQIIVEYILLLVVASVLALLLTNLVNINEKKGGHFFNYWKNIIRVIGEDIST